MAVQATFQTMGLRSERAVAAHLLENAHESNLVPDIAQVDYLAGSLGRMHLRPLPWLPTYVDDVYVYGYLHREDCVAHGGRLSCTTGEDGSAKNIIARISTAVRESMGKAPDGNSRGHIQTNIVHTLAARENTEGSAIHHSRTKLYIKAVSNFEACAWPTKSTARTSICGALSCMPLYRAGGAHASKSPCMPAVGGPFGRQCCRGGGRGLGPSFPYRSARLVCGPTTRQAVGEPDRVPRPVSCSGRPATRVNLRRLVCAHDDGQGLGCPAPTHQGQRGQRSDLGEGLRVGRGRIRVPCVSHLPGRPSGSPRGGRRAGPPPMLHQGRRFEYGLGRQQETDPATPEWPQPRNPLAALGHSLVGMEGQEVPSGRHRHLRLPPARGSRDRRGPRNLHALGQEPRQTSPRVPGCGERRRMAARVPGLDSKQSSGTRKSNSDAAPTNSNAWRSSWPTNRYMRKSRGRHEPRSKTPCTPNRANWRTYPEAANGWSWDTDGMDRQTQSRELCCGPAQTTRLVACGQRRDSKGCSMGAPTSSSRTRTNTVERHSGFLPLASWRSR